MHFSSHWISDLCTHILAGLILMTWEVGLQKGKIFWRTFMDVWICLAFNLHQLSFKFWHIFVTWYIICRGQQTLWCAEPEKNKPFGSSFCLFILYQGTTSWKRPCICLLRGCWGAVVFFSCFVNTIAWVFWDQIMTCFVVLEHRQIRMWMSTKNWRMSSSGRYSSKTQFLHMLSFLVLSFHFL